MTLKLFEMQKPCQRRRDGRCSAPGSCLAVHQEGPTRSAGDAPTAPVIVGQWHSSGGAWIPWAISLCSDAVACWGCQPGRNPKLCDICAWGEGGAWHGMPGICVPSPILHTLSQELQNWRTCLHIPWCCQDLQVTPQQSKIHATRSKFHNLLLTRPGAGWTPCPVAHPRGTGNT